MAENGDALGYNLSMRKEKFIFNILKKIGFILFCQHSNISQYSLSYFLFILGTFILLGIFVGRRGGIEMVGCLANRLRKVTIKGRIRILAQCRKISGQEYCRQQYFSCIQCLSVSKDSISNASAAWE